MAAPGVSGPGSLSRRTDRGPAQKIRELPDAQYGEAATYRDLQKQAPLAQTPPPSTARTSVAGQGTGGGAATGAPASVTPIHAPTQNPAQPVTAGADAGPGPGMAALGPMLSAQQQSYRTALDTLQQVASLSNSTEVQALLGQLQTRM